MKKIIILLCAIFCTVLLFAQNTLEEQLVEASCTGDLLAVQTLLSEPDIDVNARYNGETALTNACSEGHLEVVKELLADPRIKINQTESNFDNTPLISAAEFGHTDVVNELLKYSPKLDEQNNEGYTALMYAAEKGYKPIAHELVINGANITIVQKTNRFTIVQKNNRSNIGGNPRMNRMNNAALLAYKNDHIEILLELLKVEIRINISNFLKHDNYKSAYYNTVDEFGNTLLMLAARKGDIEVVRLLLDLNREQTILGRIINPIVDINKKNLEDNTALMLAAKYGHLEVVKELLTQSNIDLDCTNIYSKTAYDLAETQEIRDAISNYKKPSKQILGKTTNKVLKDVEYLQKKINKK